MDDRYGTTCSPTGWRSQRAPPACPGSRRPATSSSRSRPTASAAPSWAWRPGSSSSRIAHGRRRLFPLGPGFLVDGERRRAHCRPRSPRRADPQRTASGSFAVADARARVARASRILVEGRHDAELVEKVWGDDLRAEGVVVEYLQGIDLLEAALDDEPPSAERRYGVLVDHLVAGSKESRIADAIARGRHGAHVQIVGHPYVDVWQCVTPARDGHRALARRAARHRVQGRGVPRPRLAGPTTRPTSPGRGSGSSAGCRATATSSRRSSAASRSSSTSSPKNAGRTDPAGCGRPAGVGAAG